MSDPAITPKLIAKHGITPDEYERIKEILKREPELHRVGHLLRDVERALLL